MVKSMVNCYEPTRILLGSLQMIIGQRELDRILRAEVPALALEETGAPIQREFTLVEWKSLLGVLQASFGEQGALGIAARSGQEYFNDFYRHHSAETQLISRDFRMLPKPRRMFRGMEILASFHNQVFPNLQIAASKDEVNWYWQIADLGSWLNDPFHFAFLQSFIMGFLQEFLSWASGGKFYPITEFKPVDQKIGAMVIQIHKRYVS